LPTAGGFPILSHLMKVLLINPNNPLTTISLPDVVARMTMKRRRAIFLPLNLCVVAACVPKEHEVRIVDECIEEIDYDAPADVVGITAMTCQAPQAYEIARNFRERGAKVILGGIHPSAVPEEAAQHADAVAVGEAEGTVAQIFEDLARGELKKVYHAAEYRGTAPIAPARRELCRREDYLVYNTVQTTRGCPYKCTFCTTNALYGSRFLRRSVQDVVAEIQSLADTPEELRGKVVIFADDNMMGNNRWAKELCRAIEPLGIKWAGQCSITIARDRELLRLMRRSGCLGMILGLESPVQANLTEARKSFARTDEYLPLVRRIQAAGISVWGSFLFGFDNDDLGTLRAAVRFARKAKLVMSCYPILTPYPGTALYDRMRDEGRLLTEDWTRYNGASVVFRPKKLTEQALADSQMAAFAEFYSLPSMFARLGLWPFKKYSWLANLGIWRGIQYYYRFRKRRPVPTFGAIGA